MLPVIWGVWIVYLSLLPGGAGILVLFGIPHFDKIAHWGAYAVWSFLLLLAAYLNLGYSRARMWWMVLVLAGIGCFLEFGQYYMHEGRSFEVLDMAANGLGAVSGTLGIKIFKKYFSKKEQ